MPEPLLQEINLQTASIENPLGITPLNANNASVLLGTYDVRIVFSELVAESPGTPPRVEMRANLAMAPLFLKSLQVAIEQTLKIYEGMNGEIKWPPQPLKID